MTAGRPLSDADRERVVARAEELRRQGAEELRHKPAAPRQRASATSSASPSTQKITRNSTDSKFTKCPKLAEGSGGVGKVPDRGPALSPDWAEGVHTAHPATTAPALAESLVCKRLKLEPLTPELWVEVAAALTARYFEDEVCGSLRNKKFLGPAWGLAVYLKTAPWLSGCGPLAARDWVEAVLRRLHPDADDPWLAAGLPEEDTFENPVHPAEHFLDAWCKVIEPRSLPVIELARRHADRYPLHAVGVLASESLLKVASLSFWLQAAAPGEPFFVSCRQAGGFAGLDPGSAARCLRVLEGENVLQIVERARPGEFGKASEYRFVAEVRLAPQEAAGHHTNSGRSL